MTARQDEGAQVQPWQQDLEAATARGMAVAWHAARRPDALGVSSEHGERTMAELNAGANRLARLLRSHGLVPGDAVAVVLRNRPEFVETWLACLRSGLRFTAVNWHLTADEAGYIIDNCQARALLYDGSLDTGAGAAAVAPGATLRLAVGGRIAGYLPLAEALQDVDGSDLADPERGSYMLYTSGTTGRPKGVYRRQPATARSRALETAAWNPGTDCCLCTGPAYHAAPLAFNIISPLNAGVGVVMMDKWDPEQTLRLVAKHRVTHSHMVATMFHRLLQLPEDVRQQHDISSLRFVLHGAAPCPVHVKQAMIQWFGEVVYEYYAATEGGGNFFITPGEWLQKPGSVGKSPDPGLTRVLDDQGEVVPAGTTGTIWFRAPEVGRFEYFRAPEKTADTYRGDWFTLGDMGNMDADGFLFLTGRSAELIISGGVNIYPQEVDNVLLQHQQVADACTVGVPSSEWGEAVKAVVQLHAGASGSPALAEELLAFAASRLPGFKRPRSVDFVSALPRLPSGKIQRRLVRAPYWQGQDKSI